MLAHALVLVFLAAEPDAGTRLLTLTGTARTITVEAGHWGGMAPAPGEEKARIQRNSAAVAQPLSGGQFLVLPGIRNREVAPVAEFKVEPDGRFHVTLPPGPYCVIEASRRTAAGRSPGAQYVDAQCAAEQAAKCDVTWTVSGPSDLSFTLNRVQGGAPACWIGPSPPSAPRH